MPSVVHRDAAALVADVLRAELPPAGFPGPVVSRVPDKRPPRFTTVRRVGGTEHNLVTDRPTLSVECYDVTEEAAMDRALFARAIVNDLPGRMLDGSPVYAVNEFAGPAALPDPLSQSPRVTFTVEVFLRGTTT